MHKTKYKSASFSLVRGFKHSFAFVRFKVNNSNWLKNGILAVETVIINTLNQVLSVRGN